MLNPEQIPIHHRLIRSGVRILVNLVAWLAVVGLGTGFFFAPRGVEAQPVPGDLISFGCSLAIACALATTTSLIVGGKGKWAASMVLAIMLAIGIAIPIAYILLWVDPWTLRNWMDAWSFLRLRDSAWLWVEEILKFELPFAAAVGSVVGLVGGLLFLLAPRRPRPAISLALGMLLACATGPVQEQISKLLDAWGWSIHLAIQSPWMTAIEISASGATFGSAAGVVIAALLIRMDRARRSDETAA